MCGVAGSGISVPHDAHVHVPGNLAGTDHWGSGGEKHSYPSIAATILTYRIIRAIWYQGLGRMAVGRACGCVRKECPRWGVDARQPGATDGLMEFME